MTLQRHERIRNSSRTSGRKQPKQFSGNAKDQNGSLRKNLKRRISRDTLKTEDMSDNQIRSHENESSRKVRPAFYKNKKKNEKKKSKLKRAEIERITSNSDEITRKNYANRLEYMSCSNETENLLGRASFLDLASLFYLSFVLRNP